MTRSDVAPLPQVLRYSNPAVVAAFTDRFAIAPEDAQLLFEDVLRWLWLCGRLRADLREDGDAVCRQLVITPSMRLLDEMWHTFLLFSADYRELCENLLGGFVDHLPERATAGSASAEQVVTQLQAQLEYVHDHLGEATLRRWYIEYADQHTRGYLEEVLVRPSMWNK